MIFGQTIKTIPVAYDPDLGNSTAKMVQTDTTKQVDLITGIAGSSPYLRGLIEGQKDWLNAHLSTQPDDILNAILTDVKTSNVTIDQRLRIAKKRCALFLALCDLSGIWNLSKITHALTQFADACVDAACLSHIKTALDAGLLDTDIIDKNPYGGLTVLAMGKMGAYELNYSSDIDLIFLLDDTLYAREDVPEQRANFIKITQGVHKTLSKVSADGYVFRTDLRLRPNPSVTPVCPTITSALTYYQNEGRTWERSAFIKARACAGDIQAGQQFLTNMIPFVWRQKLDFAALSEINDLLISARDHKGVNTDINVAGHDIKMGRGGIREIEFFAQTQQLTYGGRNPDLRQIDTVPALAALAKNNHLAQETADELAAIYTHHRQVEHRIQMIRDAQTHTVPKNPDAMMQLANLNGYQKVAQFEQTIAQALARTQELTQIKTTQVEPVSKEKFQQFFDDWGSLRAVQNERAKELFERLHPTISAIADDTKYPDQMMRSFEHFLSNIQSSVQLFSLFETRPDVLRQTMHLCALSNPLAQNLAQNADLLGGLIGGTRVREYSLVKFQDAFSQLITDPTDYEQALNQIRRYQNEAHFQIRASQLQGGMDQLTAESAYTFLAEATIGSCLFLVSTEMKRRYGDIQGSSVGILAMGKLGSREMTATSDLDIILIFDGDQDQSSNGKRTLDTRSYYIKLTRMLISALSSQMAEGTLYEVDMRLRPSGRSGPVATSLNAFEAYQKTQAWVWEHLALSRARTICAERELGTAIERVRKDVLTDATYKGSPWPDVSQMIEKLRTVQIPDQETSWPIKKAAGGLLEIELIAQSFTLSNVGHARSPTDQLLDAVASGQISDEDGDLLITTHKFLTVVEHFKRLTSMIKFRSDQLSPFASDLFCTVTQAANLTDLASLIQLHLKHSNSLIDDLLKKYS